eukprot:7385658-Prymnesium_polylepis.3
MPKNGRLVQGYTTSLHPHAVDLADRAHSAGGAPERFAGGLDEQHGVVEQRAVVDEAPPQQLKRLARRQHAVIAVHVHHQRLLHTRAKLVERRAPIVGGLVVPRGLLPLRVGGRRRPMVVAQRGCAQAIIVLDVVPRRVPVVVALADAEVRDRVVARRFAGVQVEEEGALVVDAKVEPGRVARSLV